MGLACCILRHLDGSKQALGWFAMGTWVGCGWLTDFHTPPVLGGAALFAVQRQQCIKFSVLRAQDFLYTGGAERKRGSTSQHWRYIKISLPVGALRTAGFFSNPTEPATQALAPPTQGQEVWNWESPT